MKQNMLDNGMTIYMLDKYVDDVETLQESIGLGTRWERDSLVWKKEWEEEDQSVGRSENNVTMIAVRDIANSVQPWLQFTHEEPCKENNGRVPMLDVEGWAEEDETGKQILKYSFYEK